MLSFLFFFLLSLGQTGRISFSNQEINVNLYDFFIAFWLTWLLFRFKSTPLKESFKKLKILYIFIAWLAMTFLLSLFGFSTQENTVALLYLLRLTTYLAFFIYLSFALSKEENMQKSFLNGITIFAILTGFFSILQYVLYPNLKNLEYLGWDPHLYRVFGTFLDTSASAAVFGLILLYFILQKKIILPKILRFTLVILFALLGLLTYSRGFYVSILITFFTFLVFKKQYVAVLLTVFLFTISLFLLPKQFGEGVNLSRQFSIESRLKDEKEAISIGEKHVLFGIGYNHIRYVREKVGDIFDKQASHAGASFHSSFLIIFATSGLIGLVLFVSTLVKLSSISEVARQYVVFLSLFSLFDNILLYPVVLVLFLSFLAFEISKNRKAIFRT